MKIEIRKETVNLESFKALRKSVGWPLPPDQSIEISLHNTEYGVTAYADSKIVGMGRIVGDKGFIYWRFRLLCGRTKIVIYFPYEPKSGRVLYEPA